MNETWRDPAWGTFVWLAVVTGRRRGELCALRLDAVDLDQAVLTIKRNVAKDNHGNWYVKDTKTHQQSRLALDPETVANLREHIERIHQRVQLLGGH